MESFVQMSLREYDVLKFNSENLKREIEAYEWISICVR